MQIKRSFTEDELFRGVSELDRTVLLFLYKRYRPMVRWMVLNRGGSSEEGKDIFQDTIIELLNIIRKPGFKPRCKMKTLIFAIASYQWKYKSRPRRREIPFHLLEHDCIDEPPFPSAEEIELYEKVIWSSFRVLPETCQRVLLLSWEGHTAAEIAEMMECTEGYIRKRKSTCMQRFISSFKSHEDYGLLSPSSNAISLKLKET